MKTESHSIHDVLAKNATSFFIPPFQRAYAWGRPEIERFFGDISKIIDSELDVNQINKQEHFFGTLVIKEEKEGFANKSIIVDGQQRLTTTLLFLIALRDLELDKQQKDFITNTYLVNPSSTFTHKIKLKQVTKDWEAYQALVNNSKTPTSTSGIITSAYKLLKDKISEEKKKKPNLTLGHFLIAIQRLNVAVIFLDERSHKGEDPQIIFETLNSLGKPLTLSDLVRNFILLNLESNQQTEIYEKTWHPEIEQILKEEYTSKFFRDYLQYKTSSSLKVVSDNNTKELYQKFKEFYDENFQNDPNSFINDIVKYVKLYRWIVIEENQDQISENDTNNKNIKELLRNIFHDIQSEAFKPFVLGLLEYHQYGVNGLKIDDKLLVSTLEIIRTYLIRRRVLGLTQGENKNIVLKCKEIENIAQRKTSLIEVLTNMFYRVRMPNDIEIKNGLEKINFYKELKKYAKFILGKMEDYNAKVPVNFRNKEITIEHIMPKELTKSWKDELGKNSEELHKKYLDNIGNLILTEFNSEMGNKSFAEKKEKLNKSSLSYRLDVINKRSWNEQSIKKHQEIMIQRFLETFPLPDKYKERDNWDTQKKEIVWLSPLDDEAENLVKGSKPIELLIYQNKRKVASWPEVFLKFLKYIKDSRTSDFDLVVDLQREIFGGDDVILKWFDLKKKLDENEELSKHFKTLDGETYDQVENLDENVIFIHMKNISSDTCIERMARIMQRLYISEDNVKIRFTEQSI